MATKTTCPAKDSFERINYLYQISNELLADNRTQILSNFYSNLLQQVAKKSVQKLEPKLKRTLCKVCGRLLIAGVTAKVRVKKKIIRYRCLKCNHSKSFKANRDYAIWLDRPESNLEICKF